MIDYNHVVEVLLAPGDPLWRTYRPAAQNWLLKHVGTEKSGWIDIDVAGSGLVTLGFAKASDMRKFELWSKMQGAPCRRPESVCIKLTHRWDYQEVHVNLDLED